MAYEDLAKLICSLCSIKPMSKKEVSNLLRKNKRYILTILTQNKLLRYREICRNILTKHILPINRRVPNKWILSWISCNMLTVFLLCLFSVFFCRHNIILKCFMSNGKFKFVKFLILGKFLVYFNVIRCKNGKNKIT